MLYPRFHHSTDILILVLDVDHPLSDIWIGNNMVLHKWSNYLMWIYMSYSVWFCKSLMRIHFQNNHRRYYSFYNSRLRKHYLSRVFRNGVVHWNNILYTYRFFSRLLLVLEKKEGHWDNNVAQCNNLNNLEIFFFSIIGLLMAFSLCQISSLYNESLRDRVTKIFWDCENKAQTHNINIANILIFFIR